ncbi:MAG: hypothetical protein KDD06_16495 [Phaeodactylibacter sp.]|nr:hypothetical protein [Phaeodactylibacter sp.]MCB9288945.1 hypothetical protein [Lewinellaceae bacterium]
MMNTSAGKWPNVSALAWVFIIIFLNLSCDQWDLDPQNFPEAITVDAIKYDETNPTKATVSGSLRGLFKKDTEVRYGHLISKTGEEPLIGSSEIQLDIQGIGNQELFENTVTGLTPGQAYYYRAFAIVAEELFYGEVKELQTLPLEMTLSIEEVNILSRSPTASEVEVYVQAQNFPQSEAGILVSETGVAFAREPGATPSDSPFYSQGSSVVRESGFSYSFQLYDLAPGTYYARPYLKIGESYYYGEDKCFHIGGLWIQKEDIPQLGMANAVTFTLFGKGYICTGRGPWDGTAGQYQYYNALYEYDPSRDEWTSRSPFPGEARSGAVSFVIGNYAYVGLGFDFRDFYRYDPATDNWAPMPSFPAAAGGRHDAAAFVLDGKAYVGTGRGPDLQERSDFWIFDPANGGSWSPGPALPPDEARKEAIAFSIGNTAYVCFGNDDIGTGNQPFSGCHKLELGSASWEEMPQPSNSANSYPYAVAVIGQKAYGFGEVVDIPNTINLWEFDPQNGNWNGISAVFPGLNNFRRASSLFSIEYSVYITGGTNRAGGDAIQDTCEYLLKEGPCD